jgi:hypothetical protein
MSTRTHVAGDQPVDPFSPHLFRAEREIDHSHSIPVDLFTLYIFNNIQLPPNALEDAGHRVRLATAR